MILLVNCFVTEEAFSVYDRGMLAKSSRFDIFRYMLKSMSVIAFDRIYINYSLSDEYAERNAELYEYIRGLFPLANIRSQRLDRYGDWLDFFETNQIIADVPVFLACNDDHVFLKESTHCLEELLAAYHALRTSSELVSIWYSHWPELARYGHQLDLVRSCDAYDAMLIRNRHDCLQIVSPELLHRWFYVESGHLDRHARVRRTEDLGPPTGDVLALYPRTEMFRHFDGYSHAGVGLRNCTPLTIPPGFFETGIRLCFANLLCRAEAVELTDKGYVICSPATVLAGNLILSQPVFDFTEETVPAFWRDRIAEIIYHGKYQAAFNKRCADEIGSRAVADPCRPREYRVYIDRSGEYDFACSSDAYSSMPYLGFHKTAVKPASRALFLLQDIRFFDKEAYIKALVESGARLAQQDVAVHLLLVTTCIPALKGTLCYTLNMLLDHAHDAVSSILTLGCTEQLCMDDFFHVVGHVYGETEFMVSHNADPLSALPLMLDVFEQKGKQPQHQWMPFCFFTGGAGNCLGGQAVLLLTRTQSMGRVDLSAVKGREDIVESLMFSMKHANIGWYEVKEVSGASW